MRSRSRKLSRAVRWIVVVGWSLGIGRCGGAARNVRGFDAPSPASTPTSSRAARATASTWLESLLLRNVKTVKKLRGGSSPSTPAILDLDAEAEHRRAQPSTTNADEAMLPPPPSSSSSSTTGSPFLNDASSASLDGVELINRSSGEAPQRRASDVVDALVDLDVDPERSSDASLQREASALRRLIMERTQDQLEEIREALDMAHRRRERAFGGDEEWEDAESDDEAGLRLPDPRRLLSFLAPKVPSIRYSPDASLKIQCSHDSLDPGLAAAVLASLARVVVVRDRAVAHLCDSNPPRDGISPSLDSNLHHHLEKRRRRYQNQQHKLQRCRDENMPLLVAKERRFEQLVECLACGIDVQRRLDEYARPKIDHDADAESIDDLLNVETASSSASSSPSDTRTERTDDAGLAARDAIRAAWGLSLLVGGPQNHPHETIGGEKVLDLLVALSLLVRDRLLAQMQELRLRDLSAVGSDVEGLVAVLAQQLARDAASAMWAFGCVRACTGLHFAPLFEVGCVILCQNPYEVRRRAQEAASDASVTANVGASDVVDRLAKAEDGGELSKDPSCLRSVSAPDRSVPDASRDTLLDFLSPNEVADVLWALALHGTRPHESASQDEVVLSETATTLRDIICDRLIVWLHAECSRVQSAIDDGLGGQDYASPGVQILDALQKSSIVTPEATEVESITVGSRSGESEGHCIEVLDAAAVLAAEKNDQDDHVSGHYASDEGPNVLKSFPTSPPRNDRLLHLFSPRDLCSIAWAVAELHDSLQTSVTHVVKTIFSELGDHSLATLDGRDLSNLAWAIAKSPGASSSVDFDMSTKVVSWIADELVPVEENGRFISLSKLSRLQPPEIGRLVWAVATIASHSEAPVDRLNESSSRLALAALSVVKENLHEYGAEDLARVAWGFIELCDVDAMLSVPSLASALGKILSMVKSSLLDWESGALAVKAEESRVSRNPFSFASFFGRARFLAQLLDQRSDEPQAEEGDEFSLSFLTKKSLPLLKDLPIDPSTLCKITSSFSRLSFPGGDVFARVALRLMTSRSGRLLRECPMADLVRLCEAVASHGVPLGRERVSLFVRKLIHLFNTEWASGQSYSLLSNDAAVLIWSLGELGVKCASNSGPEGASSAHRRLHLVGRLPLDEIQTRTVTTTNCVKLLIGFVSTHLALTRPDRARDVLGTLSDRSTDLTGQQIGVLAEAVAKLKHLVSDSVPTTTIAVSGVDANSTGAHEPSEDGVQIGDDLVHGDVEHSDSGSYNFNALITDCDHMLNVLADVASKRLREMSAEELRRVLSVYALSPFRADELVAAASREVDTRLGRLDALPSLEVSIDSQLRSIGSEAEELLELLQVGEAPGLGATIRKGLTSFFRNHETTETTETDVDASNEAHTERLRSVLSDIVSLTERIGAVSTCAGSSVDDSCRLTMQGAAFELGRCADLIEHYNRIDFATGERGSRQVYDDKRAMAKQVLSRLLP